MGDARFLPCSDRKESYKQRLPPRGSSCVSSANRDACLITGTPGFGLDGDGPRQLLWGGERREASPFSSEVLAVSSIGTFSSHLACSPRVFPRIHPLVSVPILPVKGLLPTLSNDSCDIVQVFFSQTYKSDKVHTYKKKCRHIKVENKGDRGTEKL